MYSYINFKFFILDFNKKLSFLSFFILQQLNFLEFLTVENLTAKFLIAEISTDEN